jgi:hypothetical protein
MVSVIVDAGAISRVTTIAVRASNGGVIHGIASVAASRPNAAVGGSGAWKILIRLLAIGIAGPAWL